MDRSAIYGQRKIISRRQKSGKSPIAAIWKSTEDVWAWCCYVCRLSSKICKFWQAIKISRNDCNHIVELIWWRIDWLLIYVNPMIARRGDVKPPSWVCTLYCVLYSHNLPICYGINLWTTLYLSVLKMGRPPFSFIFSKAVMSNESLWIY